MEWIIIFAIGVLDERGAVTLAGEGECPFSGERPLSLHDVGFSGRICLALGSTAVAGSHVVGAVSPCLFQLCTV